MRTSKKQKGVLEVAMIGLIVFFMCALVFAKYIRVSRDLKLDLGLGDTIDIVRMAVESYATKNKSAFQQGKTIMFVNDQYAPTIAELQNLGYLALSAGTNTANPFGSTYGIKLILNANQSITGLVYLKSSLLNSLGQPDQNRSCRVARALLDRGVCTSPVSAAVLQNGTTQIANPSGQPAVVGALVFVGP